MENKIISINISPESTDEITENAGVMWEHNATSVVFNLDSAYVGDYRYYIEYRSIIGTKVRTEYLQADTDTNTVTYNIPVTMSSLRGVECYFNIVKIDDDGQTVQVIKPKKFCLEFDYSPDTDNELAKVNDFSINALLEAIRLGVFKGEPGDATVNLDTEMSSGSTNPVQNKVIKSYIDKMMLSAQDYVAQKDAEVIKLFEEYIEKNVVLKEDGKSLSSNDFTDEYRDKLDNLDESPDIFTSVSGATNSDNLWDNEWEYGYFYDDGTERDDLTPITVSIRSRNYIAVEGGRFLCQNNNYNYSAKIVQYDENKQVTVGLTNFMNEVNRWTENGITLDENTRYVRIAYYNAEKDLSDVQTNVFYIESIEQMFIDPGDDFQYVPKYSVIGEFINPEKIKSALTGKTIVYDGDSICLGLYGGGGYPQLIADRTSSFFENNAVGGARLVTRTDGGHSVADSVSSLPDNADLYCFQGGINDYWTGSTLGTCDKSDYEGEPDATTVCGALETIFRYALNNFTGKPVCFVITHKVQSTAYAENSKGNTFEDYRNAIRGVCSKYSIPCYDAFDESGLNGWNTAQSNAYLTGNASGTADGCHPNEEGYEKYYVPQLISLFEKIM